RHNSKFRMQNAKLKAYRASIFQLCILTFAFCILLSACTVGPNYRRPAVATAPEYKEQPPWRVAEPRDQLTKGQWWTLFGQDELNQLDKQALAANQTIEVARNQLQQARAAAQVATSGLFPQIGAQPTIQRQRQGATLASSGLATTWRLAPQRAPAEAGCAQ